jgi:hypothetical protein
VKPRYSLIEHLVESVLLSRYAPGVMVSMFKALSGYFDASGHPDQHQVMTVGGFVSRVDKWTRFDRNWEAILEEYSISAFHMTDYVSSQGEFAKFKGNSALRKEFQTKLSDCIAKNINKAIRFTLILTHYNLVNQRFKLRENVGSPYSLCAFMCLQEAVQWARRKKAENSFICYFEDGDKDKGEFKRRSEKMLPAPGLQFLQKDKIRPFEAADFMAWKAKSNAEVWLKDSYHPDQRHQMYKSMGALHRCPTDAKILTVDGLQGICLFLGVERR